MGESLMHVTSAIQEIAKLSDVSLKARSACYRTPAMTLGNVPQADYVNAVIAVETGIAPEVLLDRLLTIEKSHGRVRDSDKWQARTLDLDILLYGSVSFSSERLSIPHYGLKDRAFVLVPLCEIAPDLKLPDGSLVSHFLSQVSTLGVNKIDEIQ